MKKKSTFESGLATRFVVAVLLAAAITIASPAAGRKKGYKLDYDKKEASAGDNAMSRGSFMVASQCEDCNNGYRLEQIAFSGYDKPQQSNTETFFITNNTDRHMSGIRLYIEYRTQDGRQLHKRFVPLVCDIPPGQTRMAEIKSWDKQNSFHYEKSAAARRGGTPYTVIFDPVAFYLRF